MVFVIVRAMPHITRQHVLVDEVDNLQTRRALRRHGFNLSLREICDLVEAGHTPERTKLTSQLLEASSDEQIEVVLVAAYSGYLCGLIANTRGVALQGSDIWSTGIEVLVRAVRASARCNGGDFHILRSTHRDFCRAMINHRKERRTESDAFQLLIDSGEQKDSHDDNWSAMAIEELVEWLATEFDAEERVARMVVATRLLGYPLGSKHDSSQRSRNCRERQQLEERMRGFVSPAEGLAENVLSRAA